MKRQDFLRALGLSVVGAFLLTGAKECNPKQPEKDCPRWICSCGRVGTSPTDIHHDRHYKGRHVVTRVC